MQLLEMTRSMKRQLTEMKSTNKAVADNYRTLRLYNVSQKNKTPNSCP